MTIEAQRRCTKRSQLSALNFPTEIVSVRELELLIVSIDAGMAEFFDPASESYDRL